MSSTELAANLFRITQTDEVLKNKNKKHILCQARLLTIFYVNDILI